MKADGIEYEERMELLEEVTYPRPLAEGRSSRRCGCYREDHPWVLEADLSPEVGRARHVRDRPHVQRVRRLLRRRPLGGAACCATSPTPTARCARPCPSGSRRTSSTTSSSGSARPCARSTRSLLDEWAALTDPEAVARAAAAAAAGEPLAPPRPITANERAFRVMVRNAMFRRVQLAARDRFADLGATLDDGANGADWEAALGAYWDEHETIGDGPAARSPELLIIDRAGRAPWHVRQIIDDPEGHHDWAIVATVDLDASDAAGEPVISRACLGRTSAW